MGKSLILKMWNCNNCKFAYWKRNTKGRILAKRVGECLWQPIDFKLPASIDPCSVSFSTGGIWRDCPYEDCAVWKPF